MRFSLRGALRPLAAVALSAWLFGAAERPAAAEGGRVAVVDVQHAVMQTEDGIRAQATLKKLFDKRQQDLDAAQTELQKARDDIQRQQSVLSREALQRRMEDWQRRMIELQTRFVEYQKELAKKQADLTGPIIKKMVATIQRLAKKNGYDIIIDKQAAPYARSDLDLTEQVIQLYNSGDAGDSGGGDDKKDAK
jgi:outer membrane protein